MTYRFELREHTQDGQLIELPATGQWHSTFVPAWRDALAQARQFAWNGQVRVCVRLFDQAERLQALTYVYPTG